jgi:hypothetical protein
MDRIKIEYELIKYELKSTTSQNWHRGKLYGKLSSNDLIVRNKSGTEPMDKCENVFESMIKSE